MSMSSKPGSSRTRGCVALLALAFAALLGAGVSAVPASAASAPVPAKKDAPGLVWPLPPAEPKIKFVRIMQTEADVGKKKNQFFLLKLLFGEDKFPVLLQKPYGIAADSKGVVYVADTQVRAVVVFDPTKKEVRYIGRSGRGQLIVPLGVAVDEASDTLFVSDGKLRTVFGYTMAGEAKLAIGGTDEFENPTSLAVDSERGRLIVADSKRHEVRVYGTDGKFLFSFGKRGVGDGEFNFPTNVAVDRQGHIYVTDSMNFRVQIFASDGTFQRKFGSNGDAVGQFSRPKGIAVDSQGDIYVVDAAFGNFQIFDQEGRVLLFVGEFGTAPGQFQLPAGVFIDKNDRIYVADQLNQRIQVLQFLGNGKSGKEGP